MSKIKTSEAILLKKMELRETSLILTLFTKESGKISGVIKGVRSPQPQFAGVYEPFSLGKVVYYEKRNKDLFIISNCDLLEYYSNIRENLDRIAYAGYFCEFTDSVCSLSQKNEEVFELLKNSLNALNEAKHSIKRIARIFEIKMLKTIGLIPRLNECVSCSDEKYKDPRFSIKNGGVLCSKCSKSDIASRKILVGTIRFMEAVKDEPYDRALRIKVTEPVGKDIENIMRGFLDYHVQKRFKTLDFIQQVGV